MFLTGNYEDQEEHDLVEEIFYEEHDLVDEQHQIFSKTHTLFVFV